MIRHEQVRRWTLTDLLESPETPAFDAAVEALEEIVTTIEGFRPMLSEDITHEVFLKILSYLERFTQSANKLGAYSYLRFAEDTQNLSALAFMSRIEQLLAEWANRALFFSLWWKGLPNETAERLLSFAGDLQYYLEQARLLRDHILSEPEEKVINLKDVNGINALVRLYDLITNKMVFELDIDGEKKMLHRDGLMDYVRHSSSHLREAAYKELFRLYRNESTALAHIYAHRVRDWTTENMTLRRYASPVAVRNLANDIPDHVVAILLQVCEEEARVFQRYFRLKGQWLGLSDKKLRRYDLYAPLHTETKKTIPYHDAAALVIEGFASFSPFLADLAERVFDEGHLDSEVRPNKQCGAFCYSVLPGMTPFVLINYTGEPRQIATLAHELGHAVHTLSAAHHSVLTFHAPLPMAETASVFAEMLLTERLLAQERDPEMRRALLAGALDDVYATVLRQAFFVLFEREAHQLISEGGNTDELNKRYLSNLYRQFGDSVKISDDFQYEWISIPHIYHAPFYCYSYSFGQLLSLALYDRYEREGASFVPGFLRILAHGGSARPSAILSEADIDIADPDFWRGGFRVIERMIDKIAC